MKILGPVSEFHDGLSNGSLVLGGNLGHLYCWAVVGRWFCILCIQMLIFMPRYLVAVQNLTQSSISGLNVMYKMIYIILYWLIKS